MIAYSEYINNTIINKYSDKEITASGYICDEIITTDSSCSFVIKTDKINGQPSDAKIQIISYSNVDAEPFEKVNFTAHTYKNNVNSQISHGIFLKAYSYDGFKIDATGEKVFDLYSFAVEVRMTMKNSLDMLLPEDYSTLCRAVLLGEKTALDSSVKDDFSLTGTSFFNSGFGNASCYNHFICIVVGEKINKKQIHNNRLYHIYDYCFYGCNGLCAFGCPCRNYDDNCVVCIVKSQNSRLAE